MEKHDHSVSVVLDKHDPTVEKAWRDDVKAHTEIKILKQPDDDARLLDYLKMTVPDVVILNVNPKKTSHDYGFIQDIRAATPRTQVVAVVEPHKSDQAGDALLAGAIGYLYGADGPQGQAANTIHSAFHQRSVVEQDVARHIWEKGLSFRQRIWLFTAKERRSFQRLRQGKDHRDAKVKQDEWEKHIGHILIKLHSRRNKRPLRVRASTVTAAQTLLNVLLFSLIMLYCSVYLSNTLYAPYSASFLI